ncbi:Pimeloyl-ACP methyl ester carboxylesterase [Candidatus Electrothrix communis]|uniref:Pimeloyl-ACP methyl ester carboxylesterase n=1 Tax=Candidatus Electrothrix communis TaxID=1859133 RepID=A0A3S3UEI5_9BACT|nr:Pimeloyl-ACP methyl ester carboxylesterase [Candidatus Electrothrix communis]
MSQTIHNGSVELYTESFGSQDAVPVVLIAGAMAPAIFWEDSFCEFLSSNGYYVLRFDNRDIGRSTHFPQNAPDSGIELPYSINDMVDDAAAVLAALSGQPAHIIGHSLGGSIAQLFALSYPEQTRSVTALDSPLLAKGNLAYVETAPEITEELWSVLMANPMYPDLDRGGPEFLKIWDYLNGDWELDKDMALRYTEAIYATETIGPAWNHMNVQTGIRDIWEELSRLNKSLLYIHGEKDFLPANPENTKKLAQSLGNADIFILRGGGHMFFNKKIWEILSKKILRHIQQEQNQ